MSLYNIQIIESELFFVNNNYYYYLFMYLFNLFIIVFLFQSLFFVPVT